MSNSFIDINTKFHQFSKASTAEGQYLLDQASLRTGHNTYSSDIRAQQIPDIFSLEERNSNYLITSLDAESRVVGGTKGAAYTGVIKFIDKAPLIEMQNTNHEAFYAVDKNLNKITGWIDVSDKVSANGSLCNGYQIRLFGENNKEIVQDYGWYVDAFNGVIHFSSEFNPSCQEWTKLGFGTPVIEGFVYIGKLETNVYDSINTKFNSIDTELSSVFENMVSIQPFKFSSDIMNKVNQPYYLTDENSLIYQKYCFAVPGFVLSVTALDKDETIIVDTKHLADGSTLIFIDLPFDINYGKPIIDYKKTNGNTFPILGTYTFLAHTIIQRNGSKIPSNPIIDYTIPGMVIPNVDYYKPDEFISQMYPAYLSPYKLGEVRGENDIQNAEIYEYNNSNNPNDYNTIYPLF